MEPQLTAEELTSERLQPLTERLIRWEQEGTMANLERVLRFVSVLLDNMTPQMVEDTVRRVAALLELADKLATSEVMPVARMLDDVESLLREPPVVQKRELRHLWHELNDPDAEAGLELVLGLLKVAGRRTALKK